MNVTSTITAIIAIIEGVQGVENVRARPGTPLDLEEAIETWRVEGGGLQRWTLYYSTSARFGGASGCTSLDMDVRVVVERTYRESEDEYLKLAELIAAVQLALLGGLETIDEDGVSSLVTPGEPQKLETGEYAYVGEFAFALEGIGDT